MGKLRENMLQEKNLTQIYVIVLHKKTIKITFSMSVGNEQIFP